MSTPGYPASAINGEQLAAGQLLAVIILGRPVKVADSTGNSWNPCLLQGMTREDGSGQSWLLTFDYLADGRQIPQRLTRHFRTY